MIRLCHLRRHLLNHIRGDVNAVEVYIFHSTLGRQRHLQLALIDQSQLKENLAYLYASGPLALNFQTFMDLLSA
ncbi:hypothetical protein ES703_106677 [subsurface metagenome]